MLTNDLSFIYWGTLFKLKFFIIFHQNDFLFLLHHFFGWCCESLLLFNPSSPTIWLHSGSPAQHLSHFMPWFPSVKMGCKQHLMLTLNQKPSYKQSGYFEASFIHAKPCTVAAHWTDLYELENDSCANSRKSFSFFDRQTSSAHRVLIWCT